MSYVAAGAVVLGWFAVPILLKATILKPAVCRSKRRLDGLVTMVTGANTGLGKQTVTDLSSRGAVVYMACRDMQKAESARQEILTNNPQAKLKLIKVDLASLKSVRECADNFLKDEKKLDILVANAGFGSLTHKLTEDDIESHIACNHLAHFYLTRLLMPALTAAGSPDRKSRIVVLSSRAHRIGVNQIDYEGLKRGTVKGYEYGMSKLANILFTRHLNTLLTDRNITVNAVHPGTVKSEFFRNYLPIPSFLVPVLRVVLFPASYLLYTENEGAQTQIWACVDESLEGVSGKYMQWCSVASPSKAAQSDEEAAKLWMWSCSKTRLSLDLDN